MATGSRTRTRPPNGPIGPTAGASTAPPPTATGTTGRKTLVYCGAEGAAWPYRRVRRSGPAQVLPGWTDPPAPGFVMIYGQAHYAPGFGERYRRSDPRTTLRPGAPARPELLLSRAEAGGIRLLRARPTAMRTGSSRACWRIRAKPSAGRSSRAVASTPTPSHQRASGPERPDLGAEDGDQGIPLRPGRLLVCLCRAAPTSNPVGAAGL